MSIRLRLAAQFGAMLVITLVLFALAIYVITRQARREEFTQSLFRRALVVGHAYADGQARNDPSHQASYRQYLRQLYRTLPAEEGRVYDAAGRLVFREGQRPPATPLPATWLAEVRRHGRAMLEPEAHFHETVGLLYQDARLGPLVVVASSVDEDGRRQLDALGQVLLLGLLAAAAIMSAGGWLLAGQALRPLRRMVGEVDGITATDLSRRLTQAEGQVADELGHLAQRFNRLLDRLESAFVGQRTFVRDASHELRTPLTALIGELEVALLPAERPAPDYRRTLQSTLDAARQLSSLTNGLLQIARASGDPSQVPMAPVRLDELLLLAHEQILRRYPTCRVDLELSEEAAPAVHGNEALLLAAMLNVLDNACKYSAGATAPVLASLLPHGQRRLRLLVQDHGPGLSAADLEQVFVPFFRAASVRALPGHGIGLPLTAQIMALHGGLVRVASEPGHGTQVWLEWPALPLPA
jgi:signal transduction histidine kinase